LSNINLPKFIRKQDGKVYILTLEHIQLLLLILEDPKN